MQQESPDSASKVLCVCSTQCCETSARPVPVLPACIAARHSRIGGPHFTCSHARIDTQTHIHARTHSLTLTHTHSLTHLKNPVFDSYTYLDEAHRAFEKPSSMGADASPPTSRAAPSSSSSYLEELTVMKPLDAGGELLWWWWWCRRRRRRRVCMQRV
jgi:hypothetical protein